MKKLKICTVVFCYVLYATQIKSQFYGQLSYGAFSPAVTSAHLTNIHSSGFLVGYNFSTIDKHIYVYKTDILGGFSSSDEFFAVYLLHRGINCSTPPPTVTSIYGVTVIETGNSLTPPSGSRYAMVAACGGVANGFGCVFATMDQSGNIVNKFFYEIPVAATAISKPYIIESTSPGYYYICGAFTDVVNSVPIQKMYVMLVDVNGIVSWSNVYEAGDLLPAGILESPFNPGEVVIVGNCMPGVIPGMPGGYSRAMDGFFMRLSSSSGNLIDFKCYGDDPLPIGGTCNYFSSISPAYSTYGGNDGYIIGGFSDPYSSSVNGYSHSWMLKLSQTGSVIWSRIIEGSLGNNGFEVSGVLERFSSFTNAYSYFGVTSSGAAGVVSVFKLDESGTPPSSPSNSEFIYTAMDGNFPSHITNINAGFGDDGIQIFGTRNSTNTHFVKAYYDGTSGCNESLSPLKTYEPGPSDVINVAVNISSGLTTCSNFDIVLDYFNSSLPITTLCSANSIGGASNAKGVLTEIRKESIKKDNLSIYPNPTTGNISIFYNNKDFEVLKIKLYNSIGQFIAEINVPKETSNNITEVEFNFEKLKLDEGVYFLHAISKSNVEISKLIYNK